MFWGVAGQSPEEIVAVQGGARMLEPKWIRTIYYGPLASMLPKVQHRSAFRFLDSHRDA